MVEIMACRLFGAEPLSKAMMGHWQLDPQEQTSIQYHQTTKTFHSLKMYLTISSATQWVMCSTINVLNILRSTILSFNVYVLINSCVKHCCIYLEYHFSMKERTMTKQNN